MHGVLGLRGGRLNEYLIGGPVSLVDTLRVWVLCDASVARLCDQLCAFAHNCLLLDVCVPVLVEWL